jgi:serine/threonine-protein kinase
MNGARGLLFHLLHSIGEGGQADVYLARLDVVGGHFACKMLREAWDPLAREQFRREAERQARVAGDHVVRIIAQNHDAPRPFIIQEYMPHGSLADEIERRGAFGLAEALVTARSIAVALADVHFKGIAHRDLKPGNVLRAPDGSWKLNDLGIAATIDASQQVRAPGFIGTPAYAAPEQFRGLATPKSDVYALGVILEELLLGAGVESSLFGDQRLPWDVRLLIAQLRAEDPSLRPTSAGVVGLLDAAIRMPRQPAASVAPPPSPPPPPIPVRAPSGGGSGWGWLAAGAGFLGLLALASSGGGKRWDSASGRYRWPDGTYAPD